LKSYAIVPFSAISTFLQDVAFEVLGISTGASGEIMPFPCNSRSEREWLDYPGESKSVRNISLCAM